MVSNTNSNKPGNVTEYSECKKSIEKPGWTPLVKKDVKCIYRLDCRGLDMGYCALSYCPKFIERH